MNLRTLPWRGIITAGVGAFLLGVMAFTFLVIRTPIPTPSDFAVAQTSIVYYADGETELGRLGEYNRTEVPLVKVPLHVQRAVLAIEDKDFYNHQGFSVIGYARAFFNNVTGGARQGGSTITQQYAKNAYLTQEQTYKRKLKELVLSVKLEMSASKDVILQGYLNSSFLGRGAYGIQAASRQYFAKDVSQLTIAEGAVLAALLKSPEGMTPEKRLDDLTARWNTVLDKMVEQGWLTPEKRKEQRFPVIIDRTNANTLSGPNGYAVDMVKRELVALGYDEASLGVSGLRVISTFDARAQVAAVRAVEKEGPTSGTDGLRIGMAAVRPGTGEIVAVYGGPDFATEPLNNATQAIGQAGSTFKPFALAAATEQGVTLDTILPGRSGTDVAGYKVTNYSNENYGPISLMFATEHSVNSAFVQLTFDIGVDTVMDAASRAGIPDDTPGLDRNLTFVLGTASPHPLDIANSYATFAARGLKATPFTIREVLGANGGVLYQTKVQTSQVFDEYVADTVNAALRRVVTNGTGFAAAKAGRPVAGKTGTTNDNMSAWFAGYSPDLAAAVMFVKEDDNGAPVSLRGTGGLSTVTGGSFPARIWTAFVKAALEGTPKTKFVQPQVVLPAPTDIPTVDPSATATPTPTPTESTVSGDGAAPVA